MQGLPHSGLKTEQVFKYSFSKIHFDVCWISDEPGNHKEGSGNWLAGISVATNSCRQNNQEGTDYLIHDNKLYKSNISESMPIF